eukprot:GHRR01013963.1.p1 GENE.GHRR01013963.1~~GHRR01013963.1.p1  ORF type:complete len:168 (-),score=6.05 GHRR01013963.1:751-1254(-)
MSSARPLGYLLQHICSPVIGAYTYWYFVYFIIICVGAYRLMCHTATAGVGSAWLLMLNRQGCFLALEIPLHIMRYITLALCCHIIVDCTVNSKCCLGCTAYVGNLQVYCIVLLARLAISCGLCLLQIFCKQQSCIRNLCPGCHDVHERCSAQLIRSAWLHKLLANSR